MTTTRAATGVSWRRILRWAAIADLGVMAVVGLVLRDPEALAFAALVLAGIFLLRWRTGLAGTLMLGVALLDTLLWMAPAAWSNIAHRDDVVAVMVPASLATISLAGAVAAFASARRSSSSSPSRVAALVPQAAVAVFVVALAAGIVQARGTEPQAVQAGDVVIEMANAAFVPGRLEVQAGTVALAARNTDLFWHTLTIDALEVDLRTPVGATRRATVTLEPGTYTFYCIPHRLAGMEGTLVVR